MLCSPKFAMPACCPATQHCHQTHWCMHYMVPLKLKLISKPNSSQTALPRHPVKINLAHVRHAAHCSVIGRTCLHKPDRGSEKTLTKDLAQQEISDGVLLAEMCLWTHWNYAAGTESFFSYAVLFCQDMSRSSYSNSRLELETEQSVRARPRQQRQ